MIYLLGTSHFIQFERVSPGLHLSAKIKRFRTYVADAVRAHTATAIAEESNGEIEESRGASIARHIAEDMQPALHYIPCEPSEHERRALGIPSHRAAIENARPEQSWLSREEYRDAVLLRHFPSREKFWMNRFREVAFTSVLFVCGVHHVSTFACRLTEAGIPWQVICFDWWASDDCENGRLPLDEQPL